MPNHIVNRIHANKEVLEYITNNNTKVGDFVDFNLIILKPESLDNVAVNGDEYIAKFLINPKNDDKYAAYYIDKFLEKGLSDFDEKRLENFFNLIRNVKKHGYTSWYDWSIENWGTKWNAYQTKLEDEYVKFETAWGHPFPVIKALSEKFPNENIEVKYADEDIGSNFGHYIIKNGDIIENFKIDDPCLFGIELHGGLESYPHYKLNPDTGKYEYDYL
jgi:hypothetical protein